MSSMINDNGIVREMAPEEIKEMEQMRAEIPAPPSDPMIEVNAKLDKILAILGGGKNG